MAVEPGWTAIKTLFALSGNTCYYDGCEQVLTKPGWTKVKARIAHISGENPGSARYDPTMTDEQRAAFENLMLLCPNCHSLIDDLEPDRHTAKMLVAMKERKESRAKDRKTWATTQELDSLSDITLVMYRERHHVGVSVDQRQAASIATDTRVATEEALPSRSPAFAENVGVQGSTTAKADTATPGGVLATGQRDFEFGEPSAEWRVDHSLGGRPAVTITGLDGQEVEADVRHGSSSTILVSFARPFAGHVHLS